MRTCPVQDNIAALPSPVKPARDYIQSKQRKPITQFLLEQYRQKESQAKARKQYIELFSKRRWNSMSLANPSPSLTAVLPVLRGDKPYILKPVGRVLDLPTDVVTGVVSKASSMLVSMIRKTDVKIESIGNLAGSGYDIFSLASDGQNQVAYPLGGYLHATVDSPKERRRLLVQSTFKFLLTMASVFPYGPTAWLPVGWAAVAAIKAGDKLVGKSIPLASLLWDYFADKTEIPDNGNYYKKIANRGPTQAILEKGIDMLVDFLNLGTETTFDMQTVSIIANGAQLVRNMMGKEAFEPEVFGAVLYRWVKDMRLVTTQTQGFLQGIRSLSYVPTEIADHGIMRRVTGNYPVRNPCFKVALRCAYLSSVIYKRLESYIRNALKNASRIATTENEAKSGATKEDWVVADRKLELLFFNPERCIRTEETVERATEGIQLLRDLRECKSEPLVENPVLKCEFSEQETAITSDDIDTAIAELQSILDSQDAGEYSAKETCSSEGSEPSGIQWGIFDDSANDALVLVYRGTMSLYDIYADVDARIFPYKYSRDGNRVFHGALHNGFVEVGLKTVIDEVVSQLSRLQAEKQRKNLFITGHSLGAGLAGLTTLGFTNRLGVFGENLTPGASVQETLQMHITGFGFACPACMTYNLSSQLHDVFNSFVYNSDIVPRLNTYALYRNALNAGIVEDNPNITCGDYASGTCTRFTPMTPPGNVFWMFSEGECTAKDSDCNMTARSGVEVYYTDPAYWMDRLEIDDHCITDHFMTNYYWCLRTAYEKTVSDYPAFRKSSDVQYRSDDMDKVEAFMNFYSADSRRVTFTAEELGAALSRSGSGSSMETDYSQSGAEELKLRVCQEQVFDSPMEKRLYRAIQAFLQNYLTQTDTPVAGSRPKREQEEQPTTDEDENYEMPAKRSRLSAPTRRTRKARKVRK